jgi:hypothetical protein
MRTPGASVSTLDPRALDGASQDADWCLRARFSTAKSARETKVARRSVRSIARTGMPLVYDVPSPPLCAPDINRFESRPDDH